MSGWVNITKSSYSVGLVYFYKAEKQEVWFGRKFDRCSSIVYFDSAHTTYLETLCVLSDISQIWVVRLTCRIVWVIPRLGPDNSRNLTTTKETKREGWLRIKCLLKEEDQYRPGARKTLNLRFGTCIIRGQGQVKGWLWQGRVPGTLTWEQRMWTMSNGGRVQDGAKWGQSVSTETRGHFLENRPVHYGNLDGHHPQHL